jgi:hypothetical protein
VMEFSESDFEAYSMPDLALVGAFQTKAQAAQALGDLLFNSSQRRRSSMGARAGAVCDLR